MSPGASRPFGARAEALADEMARAREVALNLGHREVADALLLEISRLREHRFQVVVLGEFSRGKSTLINAVLGRPRLPARLRPTTSVVTRVRYSPAPTLSVLTVDGVQRELTEAELAAATTGRGWEGPAVAEVVVGEPLDLLRNRVELIDTPGVSDICDLRENVTLGFLPHADAALLVLDAKACFNESEERFLRGALQRAGVRQIFFVVNKVDQLDPPYDPRQLRLLEDRVRGVVDGVVARPRIHLLAAKAALASTASDPAGQLLAGLLRELQAFLDQDRGAVALGRAGRVLEHSGGTLLEGLGLRVTSLELEASEAQEVLQAAEARAAQAHRALSARRQAWTARTTRLIAEAWAQALDRARLAGRQMASSLERARIPSDRYDDYERELNAALRDAFVDIAEDARRGIAEGVLHTAEALEHDVALLGAEFGSLPGPSSRSHLSWLTRTSPLVSTGSALVGLGAMGAAAMLTSLTGVGVVLVGLVAFLGARAAEGEGEGNRDLLARETQRRVESAIDSLQSAIEADGQRFAEEVWQRICDPLVSRVRETERAVADATSALEGSAEQRRLLRRRLEGQVATLLEARASARSILDAEPPEAP